MRNFLLNRYMNQGGENHASRVRRVYQFLSRRKIDIVIDAAEKTVVENATMEEALQIVGLLAGTFEMDIRYCEKDAAIYVELLRYLSKPNPGKQRSA